jgi:hypothetical protein
MHNLSLFFKIIDDASCRYIFRLATKKVAFPNLKFRSSQSESAKFKTRKALWTSQNDKIVYNGLRILKVLAKKNLLVILVYNWFVRNWYRLYAQCIQFCSNEIIDIFLMHLINVIRSRARSSRKSINSYILNAWNMTNFEVKQSNPCQSLYE